VNTDLNGKVALVTGGGSGIGEATCYTLARAGAAVAVLDLRPEPARAVAERVVAEGGRAIPVVANVADEETMRAAVARTVAEFGGLHIVFANAGINGMHAPVEELTIEEWRATIDVNLTGTFLTVKHSIPHLREAGGGAIIITASVNGTELFSAPGYAAYSASKGGQAAFAKMAATELARWNIRVNSINPGAIRTNIDERTAKRNIAAVTYDVTMPPTFPPLGGRVADPSEVADLVLYLVSDASRYITGTAVTIDAGLTLLKG